MHEHRSRQAASKSVTELQPPIGKRITHILHGTSVHASVLVSRSAALLHSSTVPSFRCCGKGVQRTFFPVGENMSSRAALVRVDEGEEAASRLFLLRQGVQVGKIDLTPTGPERRGDHDDDMNLYGVKGGVARHTRVALLRC